MLIDTEVCAAAGMAAAPSDRRAAMPPAMAILASLFMLEPLR
ncbi:hypothetical protein [Achromobacter sp. DMS1]|nr:hypothetical protein [Achromobacter sp. DMS1]